MNSLRRILGILVMIAGILGLLLSLAGLAGIWLLKPTIANAATTTIAALNSSIDTSQQAMTIAVQALGASVDSIDALSSMLASTATSVEDTKPMLNQVNGILSETLPTTMKSATDSLKTAQQAAEVLDSAIRSLENFRLVISATPLLGAMVEQPKQAYNPEVPLAESLGELAVTLEDLPDTFTAMAENLDKADDNLDEIQGSLTTMSTSVGYISAGLRNYQTMIGQSRSSMDSLKALLSNVQTNLPQILNAAAAALTLFFFWLLAAQVVIFSQGWELYHGTAGRMEGKAEEAASAAE